MKRTSSKNERTAHLEKREETLEPIYDPAFDSGRLCDGGVRDPGGQGNRGWGEQPQYRKAPQTKESCLEFLGFRRDPARGPAELWRRQFLSGQCPKLRLQDLAADDV
jgi:hypothetical protein